MSTTKTQVLSKLSTSFGQSATAVSQKLGYSRKSDVVENFLWDLVDEGGLVENYMERGHNVFRKLQSSNRSTQNTVPTPAPASVLEDAFVDDTVNNYGYTVTNLGNGNRQVTDPNGRTKVISRDERIVVVNNDSSFRKIVKKPEQILAVIHEYSTLHKMATYVVTNSRNNESLVEDCFRSEVFNNDEPAIIFLGMAQHNKAA